MQEDTLPQAIFDALNESEKEGRFELATVAAELIRQMSTGSKLWWCAKNSSLFASPAGRTRCVFPATLLEPEDDHRAEDFGCGYHALIKIP